MTKYNVIYFTLYIFLLFLSCKANEHKANIQETLKHEDIIIRNNKDTIKIITMNIEDTLNYYYYYDKNDSIIYESVHLFGKCIHATGKNISLINFKFDTLSRSLTSEIFLLPSIFDEFNYNINLKILNFNNGEISEFNSVPIKDNYVSGYIFKFDSYGSYKWIMDLYVKNGCSNDTYHSSDTFSFSFPPAGASLSPEKTGR